MSEQRRKPGIPLGTGPGVFGRHGNKVRILTLTGAIEFVYPDENMAARVVSMLREQLKGGTPAAVALRNEFDLRLVLNFLDECFGAGVPHPSTVTPRRARHARRVG